LGASDQASSLPLGTVTVTVDAAARDRLRPEGQRGQRGQHAGLREGDRAVALRAARQRQQKGSLAHHLESWVTHKLERKKEARQDKTDEDGD